MTEEKTEPTTELVATSSREIENRLDFKNAGAIASSSAIPEAYRGDVGAVFALMLTGREMGMPPMQALRSFTYIKGNVTQKPESMRALILAAGHELKFKEKSNTKCTIWGKRKDNGMEDEVTWTMADAQQAKLAHKDNWKNYPRRMLVARATAELARDLFADVIGGISYTPEEIEDDIFMEERPIKKPKNMTEAAELATTGTIQEAEVIEVDLATDEQVSALLAMRKENGLTKEDATKFRDVVESNGWSIGKFDSSRDIYVEHHIPVEALDQLGKLIESFKKKEGYLKPKTVKAYDPDNNVEVEIVNESSDNEPITAQQRAKLFAVLGKLNPAEKKKSEEAYKLKYGEKSRRDLTKQEASDWIEYLVSLQEGQ